MYRFMFLFIWLSPFCFAQKTIDLYGSLKKIQVIPLSEISSKVTYIPLETTENCLLSDELQVYVTSKDIFVGDQQTMAFYRFDKNGTLKNTIGKKGNGPGEYSYALFFYVDEENFSFYVIDNQKPGLYKYTYEGEFVETIPLATSSWTISMTNNSILYYNSRYNRFKGNEKVYELYMSDKKGKNVKKKPTTITSDKYNMILFDAPFFYSYDDNVYYKNGIREEVYQIDKNFNMRPHYIIDCGGEKNEHAKEDFKNLEKYGEKVGVRNILENDKNILISYVHDNKMKYLWGDKENWSFRNTLGRNSEFGFQDNIHYGPTFRPLPTASSRNNVLISICSVSELLNNSENPEVFKNNFPALTSLGEDDNPAVVIVEL